VIYIAMGWAAVVYLPEFLDANLAMMLLILIGGLLYTLGGVVYAMKNQTRFRVTLVFMRFFTASLSWRLCATGPPCCLFL
jgi:Predicted membrane protein, hemolysin III homolog